MLYTQLASPYIMVNPDSRDKRGSGLSTTSQQTPGLQVGQPVLLPPTLIKLTCHYWLEGNDTILETRCLHISGDWSAHLSAV